MRTFIAVEAEQALRTQVQGHLDRVRKLAPQARWVSVDTLHLTLSFLGEVPDADVPALGEAVQTVASRHAPFSLQGRGAGIFGPFERPRVVWMALTGELDALNTLHQDLERVLLSMGYHPEFGTFEPHVTLARSRHPKGDPPLERCADALRGVPFGELPVRSVGLFLSETGPDGMTYTALAQHKLQLLPRTAGEAVRRPGEPPDIKRG